MPLNLPSFPLKMNLHSQFLYNPVHRNNEEPINGFAAMWTKVLAPGPFIHYLSHQFENNYIANFCCRVETVLNSDRILVMDQGLIKEFAPPK